MDCTTESVIDSILHPELRDRMILLRGTCVSPRHDSNCGDTILKDALTWLIVCMTTGPQLRSMETTYWLTVTGRSVNLGSGGTST